ncbi:hypothetical protein M3J09_004710 [Ascochyta lentis]
MLLHSLAHLAFGSAMCWKMLLTGVLAD